MNDLAVVILCAGKSVRMKSATSKVLHKIAGEPLVHYSLRAAKKLKPKKIVLVVAKGQQKTFEDILGKIPGVEYAIQMDPKGTGHAVSMAGPGLKNFNGSVLIMPGDVPLICSWALKEFAKKALKEKAVCSIISTEPDDPTSYGRIIRDESKRFVAIREEKDATEAEKEIAEINSGVFLVDSKWLFKTLKAIKPNNVQKEYYLTDIIERAVEEGIPVTAHCFYPPEQFSGVNDRADLSAVGQIMNDFITEYWMTQGVGIREPEQTYIDSGVEIGAETTLAPSVFLRGETKVGKGCVIDTGAVIEDSVIGDNVHIYPYSVIEKSVIKSGSNIGPFARVRPGSRIDENVKVGNFVEVKKSNLKKGVKASHLSYIGDATIGAGANIGCGTITCNYDGKYKHKTVIGEGAFIGSDVQFVAPVKIGKNAVVGAGTTITKNVPPESLALARTPQVNIKGWAKRKRKKIIE